ncbi:MAG: hypothetical protein ABI439_12535 [Rhodospirillales bacterium]
MNLLKIHPDLLGNAGLMLMAQTGQALERIPARGRARLYHRPDGKTVRLYCSNDRILIGRAESADPDAKLKMEEGADFLLLVMPKTKRTPGPVEAYLVPMAIAAAAVKDAHRIWRAASPDKHSQNLARNLWFDKDGPPMSDDYASKWSAYRLPGSIAVKASAAKEAALAQQHLNGKSENKLGDVIAAARAQIAAAAGVSPDAVKISVDLN